MPRPPLVPRFRPLCSGLATLFLGTVGIVVPTELRAETAPLPEDIDQILAEVPPFPLPGLVPGQLEVDRQKARALLMDGERRVFAAAGYSPGGRVIAFAHDAFLAESRLKQEGGLLRLLGNSLRWAGKTVTPAVGLPPGSEKLADLLREAGFQVELIPPGRLERQVDVYAFVGQRALPDSDLDPLRRFLLKGGGVVTAGTPWAFGDAFPDFATFPANRIAAHAGITFLPEGTVSVGAKVETRFPKLDEVLAAARELAGSVPSSGTERSVLLERLRGVAWLDPPDWAPVLEAVAALDEAVGPVIPSPAAPLSVGEDSVERAVVEIRSLLNQTLPAELIPPLPAAREDPGEVPPDAARVTRTVEIDGTWRGWLPGRGAGAWAAGEIRSTGLHAPPGEVIRVTVPETVAGQGFEVVIGSYGGGLSGRKEWLRYPRLQRSFPIRGSSTTAANGLGGLIGIRVARGASLGAVGLEIAGAVEAPLFVRGTTSVQTWREEVRNRPGPTAELAGDRIILTLPSFAVRELADPEALLGVWDEIIGKAAQLAAVDRSLLRQERITFERQIAAGSMHSGYPIAVQLGFGPDLEKAVDAARLKREGNWGFFHEIGHNHQHDLWALPGTGETTCNLWSVYLFEEWTGKSRDDAHPGVHPLRRRQLRQAYFDGGRNFERDWNVFTALDAYLIVQEAFGWGPFQAVFAEYSALPEADRPRSQQERNDQWVLRLSRACGKNLAPYFEAWNLPLGPGVGEELAGLPRWDAGLPR